MRSFTRTGSALLMSLLVACGLQLEEFGADGGVVDEGRGDARSEDSAKRDSRSGDAAEHDAEQRDSEGADAQRGDAGRLDAAADADAGAPRVLATNPVSDGTSVSIAKILTASFSEAMDPATITATTFTLQEGATLLPGTVSYQAVGTSGTFVPTTFLAVGTIHTGTVTTGVTNVGGLAMAEDYTWTFTTAPCGQTPVVPGAASSFAMLAGSSVTNSGPTSVTGNMGVSRGMALSGFPPGTITGGAIHAGDVTAAQAEAALTTAYNEPRDALCPPSPSPAISAE
jgi:hypothetical protein